MLWNIYQLAIAWKNLIQNWSVLTLFETSRKDSLQIP